MNKFPLINLNHTYIIAEAGVNHNGSIATAKKLIDAAVSAGADAVKFQSFQADNIVSRLAPKAPYQIKTTSHAQSQLEMIKKLELSEKDHWALFVYCKKRKIQFLSTPFDLPSIELLARTLDLPVLKIPSGEITNGPYLIAIAKTEKPLLLSTGMSSLEEIKTALGVLAFGYLRKNTKPSIKNFGNAFCLPAGQKILREKVALLQCTTEYPAPYDNVNLRAMDTIHKEFCLPVGLSDHTAGIAVAVAAVALGAKVIEKHFTLDKKMPGPDHKASLEPNEMKKMIRSIRQVEQALGNGEKIAMPAELKNRDIARKSLVAAKIICQGEAFTPDNLTIKRPGSGLSPMKYWETIGKKALKDYEMDEVI